MTRETDDNGALLRQFAETGSEDAFAALVARHVDLVYSVALRQVRNPHQAEEITQAVFIILARKAAHIRHAEMLPAWLFQTTRLTANNFLRSEMRRRNREQEAYMQSALDESAATAWTQIEPFLDTAVEALSATDRQAIILRFYQGQTVPAVGEALGISQAAAEKRLSRALDKLRRFFGKKGVALPAAILGTAISANSVNAAPAGLAGSVLAVATVKGAAAGNSTVALVKGVFKIMIWSKIKTAAVVGAALLLIPGAAWVVLPTFASHPNLRITGTAQLELYGNTTQIVQNATFTILTDGKSYRISMESKGQGKLSHDFYDRRADYASDGTDLFVLSDQPSYYNRTDGQLGGSAYPGRDLVEAPMTAKAIWLGYCARAYFDDASHHMGFTLADDFRSIWPPAVSNLVTYYPGTHILESMTGWSQSVVVVRATNSAEATLLGKLPQYPQGFKAMTFVAGNFTNVNGMMVPQKLELSTFMPKPPNTATTGDATMPLRKATFVASSIEVLKGSLNVMPYAAGTSMPVEDWRFKDIAGNYIVESHAKGNAWPVRGSAEFDAALATAKKLGATHKAEIKAMAPQIVQVR